MKGLIYSQYYSTQKALWIYLGIGLLLGIGFTAVDLEGFQPLISLIILMFSVSAATDNLKNEAAVGWYKYAITLPVSRKEIVQAHYAYYFLSAGLGLAIVLFIFAGRYLLGFGTITESLSAIMLGIGICLLVSLFYPCTYVVGADKSNIIQMIITGIIVVTYLVYNTVTLIIGGYMYGSGNDAMQHTGFELGRMSIFLVFALILALFGYFIGLNKFKNQNF
ncbi:ABC-2 transporter permease [Staphylococcus simulans]|nr:ABC-2 transporter permease [Staphylococcus simulans]MDT4010634.1 ABC-2 transporter permease [Staphylococcus simulans]